MTEMDGSVRSHPRLVSQLSIAEEDLFGSGDDEKGFGNDMTLDEVFSVVPLDEQVVPLGHDDVFMRNSDQVVPFSSSESSSGAEERRRLYRLSNGSDPIDELSIRRSSSLPDIVPKVVDIEIDSIKGRKQNLSDNSPDVVSSSENKSSSSSDQPIVREHLPILRQKSRDSKRTVQRSVSFKDNVDEEKESDEEKSSSDATSKRKQFRSSGYGTGSDKGSVQSQGSQGSVFDNSFSMGTSSDADSDHLDGQTLKCCFNPIMAMFGMNICKPSGIPARTHAPRPALSPSSNESDSEKITIKSTGKPAQELIPLLSAIHQSSLMQDTPPIQTGSCGSGENRQLVGSSSSVEIPVIIDPESVNKESPNSSSDSIQIPNFDVLLNDGSSSSSGSTSEPTDHLKHVQKKYCKYVSNSRSPPSFATCLPPSPVNESMDTGIYSRATSDMDHSQPLSSEEVFDYRSCKENMTRDILQQKISENYMLELIRSPNTPSPNDVTCLIQPRITSETIEKSSRCRDNSCEIRFCRKVRDGFVGLENTLEGQWSYGSSTSDVSDLCYGLGKHATAPCDEVKCPVRWCYFLSEEFDDLPKGELVYRALKRHYDTPVLSATVFPPTLRPSRFLKLDEHYRRDHPKYGETLTVFGDYGNVFLMDDYNVIKKIRLQEADCDLDNTIYTKLCNRQHKHIVDHIWAAVYTGPQEIHVCTGFFRGGTLEDLLVKRTLLNPVIVQKYTLQIMDALLYLHNKCGIIYLYWTTSNMLFLDPVRQHILISNLSLSVPRDKEFDVGYMKQSLPPCLQPPEIIEGGYDLRLGGVTDCWGLGCMMLEMLTGKQMWYNERHDQKNDFIQKIKNREINIQYNIPKHRIPEIFFSILNRCFEFDVKKRITCDEIKMELKNWKYD